MIVPPGVRVVCAFVRTRRTREVDLNIVYMYKNLETIRTRGAATHTLCMYVCVCASARARRERFFAIIWERISLSRVCAACVFLDCEIKIYMYIY